MITDLVKDDCVGSICYLYICIQPKLKHRQKIITRGSGGGGGVFKLCSSLPIPAPMLPT